MPVHPLDFQLQAHVYSTPEFEAIFDEELRFSRWLDFEAALAQSQAELGIIPWEAAEEITARASIDQLDKETIRQGYQVSRNSLIPVLKALRQACGDQGEFVHYGATTQDVVDTGQVLEIKATLNLVQRDLARLQERLMALAKEQRSTPMVGRSHSQQAIPITFGLKVAVWLAELRRHQDRLQAMADRVLTGQLSGAVGTMAALGPQGLQVAEKTLNRLGLTFSPVSWHTARDNMAEVASFLTMLTTSLAKICNEIFQLGKSEILELREPAPQGKAMSSSTMPHKRNPVLCERVVVLATHVRAQNTVVMESMLHENERDPRALWSEWLAMPQICIYSGAALNYTLEVIAGLEILPKRMTANLGIYKEAICSEWLLFRLADQMGKMRAQEKVHSLLKEAEHGERSVKELLAADPETGSSLSDEDFTMLDHPERYIGRAEDIVDQVLAQVEEKRKNDQTNLFAG